MSTTIPADCPRLIEVALPIREISAESVRDKSLRHGHISTLHLWWARRPLAAARAIVFASLVPDPDDPRCPDEFRQLVEHHLKANVPSILQKCPRKKGWAHDPDPYKPYSSVPDTLRNRLMAFIAKWSSEWLDFEAGRRDKAPATAEMLDPRSLVKWETGDPENAQGRAILHIGRELVRAAYGGVAPTVLDPFSGGGAIPLEAARLGTQAIANDYNPVAYLILRATCEYPQQYGKPGNRTVMQEQLGKRVEQAVNVPNVLVYDVELWARWILDRARRKIGHLYPPGRDGHPVVGYFWARTAPCSNPSCRGEIPLLRSLVICDKPGKHVALTMDVDKAEKSITFGIARDKAIGDTDGTMQSKGNVRCPYCSQVTPVADLRRAGVAGKMGQRMVAVITDTLNGKGYRPVKPSDLKAFAAAAAIEVERPGEYIVPEITAPSATGDAGTHRSINLEIYGLTTWGRLFNQRQLLAMQTFVACLHDALDSIESVIGDREYRKAIATYLGLWVSRIAQRSSNVGIWDVTRETLQHPFGRQAIPMTWDYPEANPFSQSTGGAEGGVDWIIRVLEHESFQSSGVRVIHGDGAALPLPSDSVNVIVTDPPYFDAVAYADLSDFFYVWLKRALAGICPEALGTPQTPKSEEATAHKHRRNGSAKLGRLHFENKLKAVFQSAKGALSEHGLMCVMFAHQSTEAWEALITALFGAGFGIDATWPLDTELITALKATKSALSSSITVACRPRVVGSAASLRTVRREIEQVVAEAVKRFWAYGFRGADLIVACYGPAVGVFGKYERVERADGTPVGVPELLEMARTAARDAIAGEFKGDNLSTLYYVWANLYGAGEQAWDDARLVVQIGGDAENAMEVARHQGIFMVEGPRCRLALLADRAGRRGLGMDANPLLIDALHRAMLYWKEENRAGLVRYLAERDLLADGPFWKLAQALFDVMPRDTDDWKLTSALLSERETLRLEAKQAVSVAPDGQLRLFEQ